MFQHRWITFPININYFQHVLALVRPHRDQIQHASVLQTPILLRKSQVNDGIRQNILITKLVVIKPQVISEAKKVINFQKRFLEL